MRITVEFNYPHKEIREYVKWHGQVPMESAYRDLDQSFIGGLFIGENFICQAFRTITGRKPMIP